MEFVVLLRLVLVLHFIILSCVISIQENPTSVILLQKKSKEKSLECLFAFRHLQMNFLLMMETTILYIPVLND